ncbi:MAG: hypothetical protein FH749_05625 [Firmicutes bacterium]|nr:hypothetical protein [Bacillota bacterium]
MRRGYWTGFIMGGLVGMLAARAYGGRILDKMFPGLLDETDDNESYRDMDAGGEDFRPVRYRRRYRRKF